MIIENRNDVLVYTTQTPDHDVEVTGPISLILYVATSAPNTDFTAKLVDVHQDGSRTTFLEGHSATLSSREGQSLNCTERS